MARARRRRYLRRGPWERRSRRDIDEDTRSIGNGPFTFDVELARQWGMSERVIANAWRAVQKIANHASNCAVRRKPERWRREPGPDGVMVYVGPTPDGPALTRDQKRTLGARPLVRGGRRRV